MKFYVKRNWEKWAYCYLGKTGNGCHLWVKNLEDAVLFDTHDEAELAAMRRRPTNPGAVVEVVQLELESDPVSDYDRAMGVI